MVRLSFKRMYYRLLSLSVVLLVAFNISVLRKVNIQPNHSHGRSGVKGIAMTQNGSVKLNLVGLLLPAGNPSVNFYENPIINEHKYNYINNPKNACTKSMTNLVAVISSIINFDRRRMIRRTKGTQPVEVIFYLFFLGKSFHLLNLQQRVDEEAVRYDDIVQEDYEDSERNLSLKSVSILKWVSENCPDVQYVLKKDDDVILDVEGAFSALSVKEKDYKHFIMGNSKYLIEGPIRDEVSKYFTSVSEYKAAFFPVFAHGPAYGFPKRTAAMLYQMSLRTKLFWLEDVYITGICAYRANIPVFFNKAFIYKHYSFDAV